MVDNSVDESRIVAGDGAFPATLQRVTDVDDAQRLLVAAGQYESNQRLFRQIAGELLPRPVADTGDDQAPRFIDVVAQTVQRRRPHRARCAVQHRPMLAEATPSVSSCTAEVDDRRHGTSSNSPVNPRRRQPKVVRQCPAGDRRRNVEFFAQSVDASGNVGITSNKIENFLATDESTR